MSATRTSEIAVKNRMNIPLFEVGASGPQIWSAGDMNVLVRALRALTNPSIKRGQADKVEITDGNFLIQIGGSTDGAGGTGESGLYLVLSVLADYLVCAKLTIDQSGTTVSSEETSIAKPYDLRVNPFDGETIGGVTYAYSSFTERVATLGAQSETQLLIPPYFENETIIRAISINNTGVFVDDAELEFEEFSARYWARKRGTA